MDVRLAFSRDGQIWHQAGDRQPFVPLGEGADWDRGVIYGSTLLEVENEVYVYYAGTPMRHVKDDLQHAGETIDGQLWGIFGGLAKLRKDGFVSLRADNESGEVITQPVEFTGKAVRFNAQTSDQGEITMQLLDIKCSPLSGIEEMRFQGEELDGNWDLPAHIRENLKGNRLRLRITLRNADLFTVTV